MGRRGAPGAAARLDRLADRIHGRQEAQTGPTVGDLPHGDLIARYAADALQATDYAMVELGTNRCAALLSAEPRPELLEMIARGEDRAGVEPDVEFWDAVGGRPARYSLSDPRYWGVRYAREAAARVERSGARSDRRGLR